MALAFLQGCDRKLEPEESCYFIQNGQLRRVSWKNNIPIKLYVHKSVPDVFHQDIKDAVEHWNQKIGRVLFEIEAWYIDGKAEPKRDGHSVIYWLKSWEEHKSNEQGRTTVYWRGDQIYEADIRINGQNFEFFAGNGESSGDNNGDEEPNDNGDEEPNGNGDEEPNDNGEQPNDNGEQPNDNGEQPDGDNEKDGEHSHDDREDFTFGLGKVHFKSLIIHELGHALGLDHNEEQGSVMNSSLASGVIRAEVGMQDTSSLKCEY